jgi:hypothetical protein
MKTIAIQHEETGRYSEISVNDPIPIGWYKIPKCKHKSLHTTISGGHLTIYCDYCGSEMNI